MTASLSVCALLVREGLVLAAQRKPGGTQGLKWEFPGGKAEAGETLLEALQRELDEELGVRFTAARPFAEAQFSNNGKTFHVTSFLVEGFRGEPQLREHQALRWCGAEDLLALDLSDSDRQVAEAWVRSRT